MTVRAVLRMGDPRLLRVAAPVEAFEGAGLQDLIEDMVDTMRAAAGVGLAAPQIGVDQAVVVFGGQRSLRYPQAPALPLTVLINPVVEGLTEAMEADWEGCLSVPGLRGKVKRYTHIRYRGYDRHGQRIDQEAQGFHARVVQHECDHLWGHLYPMRMDDLSQFGFTDWVVSQPTDAPTGA